MIKKKRLRRERLHRRRMLSRHVGLRHRSLLDWPDRASGLALEQEQEALLRRLRDHVGIAAALPDRQQLRRLGQVVVPQIVMHQLVMPDAFAGACVERHERVAKQVVARPIAAIEIKARAAEADERNAASLVDGGLAPVVDAAGLLVGLWRPRVVPELAGTWDAVEDPLNPPGAHV